MDPYTHNKPSSPLKIKVSTTRKTVEETEEEEEEDEEEGGGGEIQDQTFGGEVEYNMMKKTKLSFVSVGGGKGSGRGGEGVAPPCCQVENCEADLSDAKKYHKRHKVCEVHAKAPVVVVAGLRQRFCQQCSRFHDLREFDDAKRSCRRRLAGHNERRRKNPSDYRGEGSSRRDSNQYLNQDHYIQGDETARSHRAFTGGSSVKNFHIH